MQADELTHAQLPRLRRHQNITFAFICFALM